MAQIESFSCVCFDCDSTLSRLEGIDELAKRAGCEAEIAPLTTAAMNGEMPIEDVYAKRLEILRPDRAALQWLGERYVATQVLDAKATIEVFQANGCAVYVVSGGLKTPVMMLATALGIAAERVYAVDVYLDRNGRYDGFEVTSPLTRSDGKARVAAELVARHGRVALVGDGMTDVAARQGGAFVVGFGGVVRRDAVVAAADVFVDGPSLLGVVSALRTRA